jgi:hypothetical protein
MYTLVVCALEKEATNEVIVLAAVITSFAVGWTVAQSCESKTVSRKASRFMMLPSFVRKCMQDAHESQAASKEAPHATKAIHGKVSEFKVQCSLDHRRKLVRSTPSRKTT